MASSKPPSSQKSTNYRLWYGANYLNSVSTATIDPYFPIYVNSIGGTPIDIGLTSGIFFLMNATQLLWAKYTSSRKKYVKYTFFGRFITAILFIPIAMLKFGQVFILIILRGLQGLMNALAVISETTYLAEMFDKKERKQRLPTFTQVALTGALSGTLLGGFLFTVLSESMRLSRETTFVFMFLWSSVLGVLGAFLLRSAVVEYDPRLVIVEPDELVWGHVTTAPSKLPLAQKAKQYVLKFSNFYTFTAFAVIFYFAVNLVTPFFIILVIEEYHQSFFAAAILTSVSIIFQILSSMALKKFKILDNLGNRVIIFVATVILAVSSFVVILPLHVRILAQLTVLLVIWIVLGIGWGMLNTALQMFLLDILHPKYRGSLIATYNISTNVAMFLAPVIGGLFIALTSNISTPFIIRGMMLLAVSGMLVFVKDPEFPGSLLYPIRRVFERHVRVQASSGLVRTVIHATYNKLHARFKK